MDGTPPDRFDLVLLGPLVNQLIAELSTARGWWAAAVVAACVLVAMGLARRLQSRLHASGRGAFAMAWARRVVWPLLALALLLVARAALSRLLPTGLISIAIALAGSLAAVRTLVLVLRQTFRSATWLATFERTIAGIVWIGVALHLLDLLPVLLDTLDSVALTIGKSRVTLLQAVTGIATVVVAGVLALWASRALDARLEGAGGVDQSARVVIGRIAQPLLMVLALMVALPMIGIDLTTLSVFGGALGVGLGFGMQKIAANYVSGFIILLDRSIQPGRLVKVGAHRGTVSQIRTRYTVLRGGDGVEAIVPNEMLIASVVESETFSNTLSRVAIQIGIAYGSDVERAMALVVDVARAQPRVLAEPAPVAFLTAFTDTAITLELGFWIDDPQAGALGLRSDIYLAILRAFGEAGIGIPFAPREVSLMRPAPADAAAADGAAGGRAPG